jgi:predicted transcriptional regulator
MMAKRPVAVKQTDLTRYAKGFQAAGISEFRVEIDAATGNVAIIAGPQTEQGGKNPCDRLLK